MSDFPARRYFLPSANFVDSNNNYTDLTVLHDQHGRPVYNSIQSETWLQRRASQLLQLDRGITCSIKTNGNTLVDCGDVVEFNLPAVSSAKTEDNDRLDFFYRGRFLVRRIRQDFDIAAKKHDSIITLVKDSLQKELANQDDCLETEPAEAPPTVRKFYINK